MALDKHIIPIALFLFLILTGALDPRQVGQNSKAGLAWPNGPWVDIHQYTTTGKVSWYYTWSPDSIDTTLEFVPMLWGERQIDQWTSTVNQTIKARGVTHSLAFNEPELSSQSNLTVQQGVELWKTYVQPLKGLGIKLGSPAPSSAPAGKTWLQDFLNLCGGDCTVDFIALHWYAINSTQFIKYLQDFHTTFQRPIWVTEWACQNYVNKSDQCSQQDVIDFMNATQSFMDETEWVERYSWFGAAKDLQGVNQFDGLMDAEGKINDLGRQYIGATSTSGPVGLTSSGGVPLAYLVTSALATLLVTLLI